ncbi:unnamed protein product [Ambrosiozyma monospora]|uniref:Unnamed protein product n=1 Tax=Ambrosiozyma monospora TaxID=43982 RepID=A0ACB5SU19_AMBMO|nr:unnamed protein product [Ambrosiozyma monospora]
MQLSTLDMLPQTMAFIAAQHIIFLSFILQSTSSFPVITGSINGLQSSDDYLTENNQQAVKIVKRDLSGPGFGILIGVIVLVVLIAIVAVSKRGALGSSSGSGGGTTGTGGHSSNDGGGCSGGDGGGGGGSCS